MKARYEDILSRIKEDPKWYDQNGTPRFDDFHPDLCPNIYASQCVLLLISCQDCGKEFRVEMNWGPWLEHNFVPKKLHYGDPPIHGCVGDTMNCNDHTVLQVWEKQDFEWVRRPDLEGLMNEPQGGE